MIKKEMKFQKKGNIRILLEILEVLERNYKTLGIKKNPLRKGFFLLI
jgi:hypothetical protein